MKKLFDRFLYLLLGRCPGCKGRGASPLLLDGRIVCMSCLTDLPL